MAIAYIAGACGCRDEQREAVGDFEAACVLLREGCGASVPGEDCARNAAYGQGAAHALALLFRQISAIKDKHGGSGDPLQRSPGLQEHSLIKAPLDVLLPCAFNVPAVAVPVRRELRARPSAGPRWKRRRCRWVGRTS